MAFAQFARACRRRFDAWGNRCRVARAVRAAAGFSLLAVGVIMLVTPGPAVVVIPSGLAMLAPEFPWARRVLLRLADWTREHRLRRISKVLQRGAQSRKSAR
ncbi:MAG: PGPGW domain-containing protein [Gammaproteobacteria bacterium]